MTGPYRVQILLQRPADLSMNNVGHIVRTDLDEIYHLGLNYPIWIPFMQI